MQEHLFEIRLKQYDLLSLLKIGSEIINDKFIHNRAIESVPLRGGEINVTAWDISDINYYAIKNTHEFVTRSCKNEEYIEIINEFLSYDNDNTKIFTQNHYSEKENLLAMLWGLSRKQFWYQEIARIKYDFNRQVEILEIIQEDNEFDLNLACKAETGFSIREYRLLLFVLAGMGMQKRDFSNVTIDNESKERFPFITSKNVINIRNQLTANYNDIRKSKYHEEIFYLYPFVRTISNNYICANQYILYSKVADGPLWAIRNYYKNKSSQRFLTYYGKLFERYVEKLLKKYVTDTEYFKIPRSDRLKIADWILETPHYQIIIEQKAYLPELLVKARLPQVEKVLEYIKRYDISFLQLESTRKYYQSKKTTLKVILHYDLLNIANSLVRENILGRIGSIIEEKEEFYFIDITSFERLITIYKTNMELFEKILDEKRANSIGAEKEGWEFDQLLNKYKVANGLDNMGGFENWEIYKENF
jgi:hypothetical protein